MTTNHAPIACDDHFQSISSFPHFSVSISLFPVPPFISTRVRGHRSITGVSRGHLAIIAILRNDVGGRGSALATGLCMHGNHYEYSPYCRMQTE